MNSTFLIALIVAIGFGLVGFASAEEPGGKRIVGYFTEWGGERGYHAQHIPAEKLTHVIYAFARIKDGECSIHDPEAAVKKVYSNNPADASVQFHGHFRQLHILKQKHPHLRTLISVGGWGGSAEFSDAALTEESRRQFARSCAVFVSTWGFDGVDIDWEFPGSGGKHPDKARPQDTRNFTLLLQELRRALDEQSTGDGKTYLLTIAAPAGPQNYRNIELEQIHKYLDWINLMTYDYAGSWSRLTSFNSPLFPPTRDSHDEKDFRQLSADDSVRAYLAAGVPADKILLGVPFYGRAFGGVKDTNHGLFQPHDGSSPKPVAGHGWSWSVISKHYIDKRARRFWHDAAKVPWLYDQQAQVMITYDDPQSLREKARYAREKNLGGVMIWELSQDDENASLVNALHEALNAPAGE